MKKKESKEEIEIIDKPLPEKKSHLMTFILIISILILAISAGTFIYLKLKNNDENQKLNDLNQSILKVKNKISDNEEEKKEKESKYQELQKEYKEQLEELSIWKETEEKLQKSLS